MRIDVRLESQRKILAGYLLVLPSFLFLAVFTYYPVVRSVWLSMFQKGRGGIQQFVGLGNYEYMFATSLFWQVLKNNLVYTAGSVVPAVAFGLLFAVLLNQSIRLRGWFRLAFFYPTMVPMAAASMVWIFLFNPAYGIVNRVFGLLSLPGNIDWLNRSPYALMAIIIVAVWKYAGYYMLLFLAGLQSIGDDLYEVAIIEGATVWEKFRYITFPLLTPTTFFVTVIAVINSFQAVDQVYVMTRGGPYNTTNVLLYYIYQNGFLYWDVGLASSASTVLFAILLVFTLVYFKGAGRFVHYER